MTKHWIVASLSSAGGDPHVDVVTIKGDAQPGAEIRRIVEETRGPVTSIWNIGPMESLEAARFSVQQLRDMANFVKVMAEQAAAFK